MFFFGDGEEEFLDVGGFEGGVEFSLDGMEWWDLARRLGDGGECEDGELGFGEVLTDFVGEVEVCGF